MPRYSPVQTEQLAILRQKIQARFDLEEIRTLVFDLQINYDDLRGEVLSAKVRALLEHLEKRDQIQALLELLKQRRPNEDWDNIFPAEPEANSPYKGLQFFDEADAPLFFGREQLTAELVDHLRQHRFLAVVGASGSGKSSVVRAGVVPTVRGGTIVTNDSSSSDWLIHVITPGDEPLKALAASLTRDSESVTATKTLLADLQADTDSLDLFLYRQIGAGNGRLLIVIDQFEELFTQCWDTAAREMFIGNLVMAANSGEQGRLSLILTLRADFYSHAVQFEGLRPLLETQQKIVGAMTADELRQAVEGPASRGYWAFQPGLVDTILQDVGREPGALPLLSHALQETWVRREGRMLTLAGYQAAGGVRRAIAHTADAVYASLTPEQQAIARNIFLRLTELGEGTEDTRRRAALTELLPEGERETVVGEILDLLARKRLLTLNEKVTQPHAEVAHEALIREWPVLREWLDENREGLRIQRQVTEAAQAWQARGEDADYLYRGGRLVQAQEWIAQSEARLNELERRFLSISQRVLEQEVAEREAQRQRELEQAKQLADAQARRIKVIRQALGGILLLLVIAIGTAVFGFVQSGIASDNLATATVAQGESQQSLSTAVAAQQTAEAESYARATQKAIADESAYLAATQAVAASNAQATAEFNAQLAATREAEIAVQSHIAQSQAFAASSFSVQEEDPMRSLLLAIAAGQEANTPLSFEALFSTLLLLGHPRHLLEHDEKFLGGKWSFDGDLLATWTENGAVWIWDMSTGQKRINLDHEGNVNGAIWNKGSNYLLTWSDDGSVRVWDVATGEEQLHLVHGASVYGAAWNESEEMILTWGEDKMASVWDAATGTELLRLPHYSAIYVSVESLGNRGNYRQDGPKWNRDESELLTWGECDEYNEEGYCISWLVQIWDVNTGIELLRVSHDSWVNGASWNNDESKLVTWDSSSSVRVWNAITGSEQIGFSHYGVISSANSGDEIFDAVLNKDASQILTWSIDGTARLWDMSTGTELLHFKHESYVWGAMWNKDESQILTWSFDGTAKVWDAVTGEEQLLLAPAEDIDVVGWHEQLGLIWTWNSYDNKVRMWDVAAGKESFQFGHEDEIQGLIWNENMNRVVVWSRDNDVRVWDVQTVATRLNHTGGVLGASWNRDENLLLSWSWDGSARIWNVSTGLELNRFNHDSGAVRGADWSQDASQILTWSDDETVRIWDVETGEEQMRVSHDFWVGGASWNVDETQVAVWGNGGDIVYIWDLKEKLVRFQLNHEDTVEGVIWSKDGSQIITWSSDNTVRMWNSFTGEEEHRLTNDASARYEVWLEKDGQILSANPYDYVQVWDIGSQNVNTLKIMFDGEIEGLAWNSAKDQILIWGCGIGGTRASVPCTQGLARIWKEGTIRLSFTHEERILGAAWSEDEQELMTWGSSIKVWDTVTGGLLFSVDTDNQVAYAQWSHNGDKIIFVTSGGLFRTIPTRMEDLLVEACDYTTRNLTWQEWQLYFPGQPYRVICPQWAVHSSVP